MTKRTKIATILIVLIKDQPSNELTYPTDISIKIVALFQLQWFCLEFYEK